MSGFTEEQMTSIEWFKGPLLVLGTPGSGKTTVIVNRINNLICKYNVSPKNILVITFTKAAAESMKRRFLDMSFLDSTDVRFGTFHSFFYWIIRTAYRNIRFEVLDEDVKRQVIRNILRKINREEYDNEEMVGNVINQLGRLACDMIDIENYYSSDMAENDFKKVYYMYKDYKEQKGLIDFDDMVLRCYQLLNERKDILEMIRKMYPYIMIDEFQDTNLIQYEIIKMLAHPLDNIYVVGDDDQSIYGFRGARPDIMLSFTKEFKGADVQRLSYNFRCPPEIVELSSGIIADNRKRYDKSLKSAVEKKGNILGTSVTSTNEECDLVCKRIRSSLKKGTKADEIAVLYRTNEQPAGLIYRLKDYNIDFNVRDVIPDLFSSPFVAPVLNYIEFALGNHSRDVFVSFMNKPVRYISRDMLKKDTVSIDELIYLATGKDYLKTNIRRLFSELRTISKLKPYTAINYIRDSVGYDDYLIKYAKEHNIDKTEVFESLEEFHLMTRELKTFDELYDMIDEYRQLIKQQEIEKNADKYKPRIQLMTLHSAKGLEFKDVHIIDVVDGIIPHKKSKRPDDIEEERRMLYVGVTRSSENLYLYFPENVRNRETEISRFLKEDKFSGIIGDQKRD